MLSGRAAPPPAPFVGLVRLAAWELCALAGVARFRLLALTGGLRLCVGESLLAEWSLSLSLSDELPSPLLLLSRRFLPPPLSRPALAAVLRNFVFLCSSRNLRIRSLFRANFASRATSTGSPSAC